MFCFRESYVDRKRCECTVSICIVCSIFVLQSEAYAQAKRPAQKLTAMSFGISESIAERPRDKRLMLGKTIDWHQTAAEEIHILRFLRSQTEIVAHNMTIEGLASLMSQFVPVFLHRFELDEFGVAPTTKLDRPTSEGSVAVQLLMALEPLDLTLNIRHGHLVITLRDQAELDPMIRSYPIGPSLPGKSYHFDSLMNQFRMHIAPDSWLQAGGANSMTVFERENQWLLNVSAPLPTQLRVSALLEQLLPPAEFDRATQQSMHRNAHSNLFNSLHPHGPANTGGFFRAKSQTALKSAQQNRTPTAVSNFRAPQLDLPRGHLKLAR